MSSTIDVTGERRHTALDAGCHPARGDHRRPSPGRTRRVGAAVAATAVSVVIAVSGCSADDDANEPAAQVSQTAAGTTPADGSATPGPGAASGGPAPATEYTSPEPVAEGTGSEPVTGNGGPTTVSESDLENRIVEEFTRKSGEQFSADCPGDLAAEVGAEMRCNASIRATGNSYDVDVTVVSVADGAATFNMSATPIG
ncbi:DUF4333 domain-containing protein [Frankia sp. CNm7]|uniref:DUF4333 domain-containing protein n=1 Tax=Frankia nepalensis TaxID=1836974 RepID=A0A937RIM0_9ACTN|nr:DUF4333 domain-containing protein [Frankia nepalensis]MBL7495815.1 DUF4333 domain-containing protein [Frankia nepalensis]MBL7509891.1 DUF4333 domain-containing protein [Frankia nepalensis]MBL7517642.1 DUF4333 domain-containing protein [Frankia nepalensis]MBL7629650.1 DUF4333 domain-containing protein [Frankia nepalensis]